MAFLAEQGAEASAAEVERICRACAVPLSHLVELSDGARGSVRAIRDLGVRMVILLEHAVAQRRRRSPA